MKSPQAFFALSSAALIGLSSYGATAAEPTLLTPDEVEWSASPPSLPEGAEASALLGSPAEAGLFALRLKFPAGYHLPPHTHPGTEIVTVISGEFGLGMGDSGDEASTEKLSAGSFVAMEPGTVHYAHANEETVVQLNSEGPWQIDYVDPTDDPRK